VIKLGSIPFPLAPLVNFSVSVEQSHSDESWRWPSRPLPDLH
jgi:hypothetical protein